MKSFCTARLLAAAMPVSKRRDEVVPTSCTAMNSGLTWSNCCWSASGGAQETNNSRSLAPTWRPISFFSSER
jgi:hypothetical protein